MGEEKDSGPSSSEEEVNILCAGPAKTEREPGLPSFDSGNSLKRLTDWAEVRRKVMKDEDFMLPYGGLLAMPVRCGRNNADPRWEPISHYDIIELRKAVKDSSLSSPYFNYMVRSIFHSYDLTPSDCRNISSLILMNLQYILWYLEWQKHFSRLVERYAGGPHAHLTLGNLLAMLQMINQKVRLRLFLGLCSEMLKMQPRGLF